MSEHIYKDSEASAKRRLWTSYYKNKYLNIWLNRVKIEGLTKPQRLWLLKNIWNFSEPICAFKGISLDKSFLDMLPEKEQQELGGNVGLCLAPFATSNFNMYDYDATGYIINNRGVPYVPKSLQRVGKDVAVMYPTYSGCSLSKLARPLIDSLVDCEMQLRKSAKLAVGSAGIEVGVDSPQRADILAKGILGDEIISYIDGGETKSINPFNAGFPWLSDKIRIEKEARESELRCLLGIASVATEKKERLIKDEASALDEMAELSEACFKNPLKEFFGEIKEVLGFDVRLVEEDPEEEEEEESEDGDRSDNVQ